MKKIYLLFLMLLIAFTSIGQNVEIGTGTSTGRFPLSAYFGYERTASLFTAAEIAQTGNIAILGWYANSAKSTNRPLKIYLKQVPESTLTAENWATLTTGATLVYDSSAPVIVGWNTFNLTDAFNYTGGTNNLLVLVETNYGGSGAGDGSTGAQIRYTTATAMTLTTAADTTAPTGNLTLGNNRPNIQMLFAPMITCFTAQNIFVNSITVDSAILNWTAPTPIPNDGYEYEVRTDTNPGVSGAALVASGTTLLNELTASISGLSLDTSYNVYVRANCGLGNLSQWSSVSTFRTLCLPSDVPYLENFDSYAVGDFPQCWIRPILNSGYPSVVAANSSSGPNSLRFQSLITEPTYAITPAFSSNIETLRVLFNLKREGVNSGQIEVGLMTDPSDLSSFVLIQSINPTDNNLHEYVIPFNDSSVTGANIHIAFKHVSESAAWYYWLDDVVVEELPSCLDMTTLSVSDITKNGAKVSWTALDPLPDIGYEYEVRTSGAPGTPGAIETGLVSSSEIFKDFTNLLPLTEYSVYFKSVCSETSSGVWSPDITFMTLCDYPDLVSTIPGSRCGYGTVNLSANYSNNSIVSWYSSLTGGFPLFTGTNFVTPNVETTTSYFVQAGIATPNSDVQVGNGTSLSTSAGQSPFYYSYGGYKHQYIYTAEELLMAGLTAGPINSVAFDVKTASSVDRLGFTIYIGTTTQDTATSTHVSALTQVYSNAAQPMNLGVNPYVFTAPFVWDGVSNIVVQVNWSNNNGGSYLNSGSVAYHSTSPVSKTTYTYADNRTVAQILATLTGGVPNDSNVTSGGTTTSSSRANTFFNGVAICASPRTEVVATITTPPVLTLSTDNVEICEGQTSTVTVVTGAADYNTFVWSPSTGVTGNATTGWTFNPTESTVYTLTASQNGGSLCSNVLTVTVDVNPLPLMLDLGEEQQVCAGTVLELRVGDNTVWPTNYFNSFESSQVQGFVVGATGGVSANTTNLVSSMGARSLQITHTSSALGYVTLSNSLDLTTFTAPYLTFSHIAALEGSSNSYDYGYVEYSLDGGTTWIVFKPADYVGTAEAVGSTATIGQRFSTRSYTEWIDVLTSSIVDPTNALWKSERFNFPTNVNLSNVMIRFKVTSDGSTNYAGWFIDDINIKEAPRTTAIWSPATNLYTDAAATVPYVAESDAAVVYFKSDVAMAETDYEVIVISAADCSVTQTVAITNVFVDTPVALDQSFCDEVEVLDITVTGLTTGAALKWYDSEISTTEITSIATTGTYYVVQELNGCSSSKVAVDIEINGVNVAPVTNTNQNFCGVATVTDLEATALTGNTIGWFDSETSTTVLESTDLLISGTYYVSQYNGHCWSPRAAITVSVFPVPDALTSVNQIFCGVRTLAEVDLGQASNATLNWYESATSTSVLPLTTQIITTTYFVTQTIDGCESSRVSVPMTVQAVLSAPTVPVTQLYCTAITIADLDATADVGGTIGWFDSLTSNTPLASTLNVVTGTYYVSQYNGACWSPMATVEVTVGSVPASPNNESLQFCGTYTFGQISLGQPDNATLNWYETSTSTSPLESSANVVGGTYYVSQTVGGCESARVMINISQTDALSNPTAVSQTFCGAATVADLVAQGSEGATIVWYNSSVALNPLSPNVALTTGAYYAAQTRNGCFSARVPISVFVVSVAGPNVDTFNFCGSAKVSDLVLPTPTGVVYKWFNSPSSSTELDANTVLVSGTYFVSRTQYGCESTRTAVTVNINSVPDAPTGVTPQAFIEGSMISDIVMNQSNVTWYISAEDAVNGVNPLVSGMPLVNGTTYYGVIIGTNGCPSLPFALTVDVYLSDKGFVKNELEYYPNPVEDLLRISYSDRILQIEVFDLLGKRVKVKSTDDKEVDIDLSDLASGTYMIQLKTESKQQFIKVVKK